MFSIVSFEIKVFPNPVVLPINPIKLCGNGTAIFNLDSRKIK